MQQTGYRSKVVATEYRKNLSHHEEDAGHEVLPPPNQDVANIMSLPGSGPLVSEAHAVVLRQFVLFNAIVKEKQPCRPSLAERFEFLSTPVHFNINKDTLLLKHFAQQNTSALYDVLDNAISPIIDNDQVPVSFCWNSFIRALTEAPSKDAKLAIFTVLLRRKKWTAIIYEEFHFLNLQQRIDSGLFGPRGEDDRIPINILDSPHVNRYLDGIDWSALGVNNYPELGRFASHAWGSPDPDEGLLNATADAATALHHIHEQWLEANGCFDLFSPLQIPYIDSQDPPDFIGHSQPWTRKSWNAADLVAQWFIAQLPDFEFAVSLLRLANPSDGE